MAPKKAEITPDKPDGAAAIPVLFNPSRYGLDAANELTEVPVAGRAAPLIQFIRGTARVVTMQLFFDTFAAGGDVRTHTDAVYRLLEIEPTAHRPPICEFRWGRVSFRAMVQRISGQFTLFLPDGTPVRATLDVTFRQVQDSALARPNESADHAKVHVVVLGESLPAIAAREYGDAGRWRPVALANGLDNPRRISPGQTLVIPPLR